MANFGLTMNSGEDTMRTWRVKEELRNVRTPMVMGILNATPDSFHAHSRVDLGSVVAHAERMIAEGADILDIGGASSRPGAAEVSEQEELDRVLPIIGAVRDLSGDVSISVDTWRSGVAKEAVRAGAGMVNDIGAGLLDPRMLGTVAELGIPYVIMHMQGRPSTMQVAPRYTDVVREVVFFLSERLAAARQAGIPDVLVDPGFGFGKTTAHNYALLHGLRSVSAIGVPVLVGLSRKRMITSLLGTTAENALNGTTVLNTLALMEGASVVRVHDVREAREAIALVAAFQSAQS